MKTFLICVVVIACIALITAKVFKKPLEDQFIRYVRWSQYRDNAASYPMVDKIPLQFTSRNNIPEDLKHRLAIVHIDGLKKIESKTEKCERVIREFCRQNTWGDTCRTDIVVFDVLEYIGAYFPSLHTDTEWNKVTNHGFQVWCLEYNNNPQKVGNMFIFSNPYLDEKYKDTKNFLRVQGDEVMVVRNCESTDSGFKGIDFKYILERMSQDTFIQNTTKYYLDLEEGDCMAFDTNLLHMSDYRDKSNNRKSYNFRVAIKNANNQLHIDDKGCGFVKSVKATVNNPGTYDLVEN